MKIQLIRCLAVTMAFNAMTLSSRALDIVTTILPTGMEMVDYSAILQASNGVPSYTWSIMPNLVAWGANESGQTTVPPALSDVVAISGEYTCSLALRSNGTVVAWGSGSSAMYLPAGLSNIVAIDSGDYHSLALRSNGTVVAWGDFSYGQTTVPSGLSNVVAIAGGNLHSLALKNNGSVGTVVAWGSNYYGQTNVPGYFSNIVAIAAGGSCSMALGGNGRVAVWGSSGNGQTSVPAGLSNVVAIAMGRDHCLALKADGRVVAWGNNGSGETNVPSDLSNVVAIAGGWDHSLALKSDGTLVAWGSNGNGQTNVPPGLSHVVAISCGRSHSLALRSKSTELLRGLSCSKEGLVSGIPTQAGTCDVTYVAQDSIGSSTNQPFRLVIEPNPNKRPIISSNMPPIGAFSMGEVASPLFKVWASDPEGSNLTYSWTWDGVGMGSNASSYTHTTAWGDVGLHTLRCYVSDDLWMNIVSAQWDVMVLESRVVVSGNSTYAGGQTGVVRFVSKSNFETNTYTIAALGAYVVTNHAVNVPATLSAYRDSNSNATQDSWEAVGFYTNNPVILTNDISGVNITLTDPDHDGDGKLDWVERQNGTDPFNPTSRLVAVNGSISYTGGQTGGVRFVSTSSLETNGVFVAAPGAYFVTNHFVNVPAAFKAYRDSNSNATQDYWEAVGYYTNNPVILTNDMSGVNIILTDPDHDGDGKLDWVERQNGTDPYNPTSRLAVVNGSISYTGGQTGVVRFVSTSSLETNGTAIAVPGACSMTNHFVNIPVVFNAYRDSNNNTTQDYWEAVGLYTNNPVILTNDLSGVNITLTDPDHDRDGQPDYVELINGTDPYEPSYVIIPSNGPFAGGNIVLVTNVVPFIGSGSDITNVTVGGVAATFASQGVNRVTITMPSTGVAGLKDIVFFSSSLGTSTLHRAYRVNPAGQIYGCTPASGRYTGGYQVVIRGTNLCNGSDVTNITLCGVSVSSIISKSASQVVVMASAGTPVLGNVVIYSTSCGASVQPNGFSYNPLIIVSGGLHGSIAPSGDVDVVYGGNTNLVVKADAYYHIASLLTNGVSAGVATGQRSYTSAWVNVTSTGILAATFAENVTTNTSTPEWWLAQYGWSNNFEAAAIIDFDHDGLTNFSEYIAGADPRVADTDGDGLLDGAEVYVHRTDPTKADTDGDGMPDGWEVQYAFNPLMPSDAAGDADADGLTNLQEYQNGTNPRVADTDGDGLSDGLEVNTLHTNPASTDTDGDGVTDQREVEMGTNPLSDGSPLQVDDDSINDPGPDDSTVSDPMENGTRAHPYDAIQKVVNVATNGQVVLVLDGTYSGLGNFDISVGTKKVKILSLNGPDATILDTLGAGRGFWLHSGETTNNVISGFTIRTWKDFADFAGIVIDAAKPRIENCKIVDCGDFGVKCQNSASPVLSGLIVESCKGGILCSNATPLIERCYIVSNTVSRGGGVSVVAGAIPTIINSVITRNVATDRGGGLYVGVGSSITSFNCTVVNNAATVAGGGLLTEGVSYIRNMILWANTAASSPGIYRPSGTVNIAYSDVQQTWPGTVNVDPLFRNGSDYVLSATSPCIDTGTGVGAPTNDWRGAVRPADGDNNGSVLTDMGAYEYQFPALSVSPTNIELTVRYGYINSTNLSLQVWNKGAEELSYSVYSDVAWASATPTNGTSSGETDAITLALNTAGLVPGTHYGHLVISPVDSLTATVMVNIAFTLRDDNDGDGMPDWQEIDLGRNADDPNDAGLPSALSGIVRWNEFGLPGAFVELRGISGRVYYQTRTDGSGAYTINSVLPGNYFVKVGAERFADEWYSNATHRTNSVPYSVPANTSISGFNFELAAGQNPALVEVTSDPAGAEIYVDYQDIALVTPALVDVGEVASHVLVVRKAGYAWPVPQAMTPIEAETVNVHFDLTSAATGSLIVSSAPAGAVVYVDQVAGAVGVTPVIVGNLDAGSHTIILRQAGYLQARPVSAMVIAGTSTEVMVPLVANTTGAVSRLNVDIASTPPGADVYVDYLPTGGVTPVRVDWLDAASHSGVGWHSASHVVMVRKNRYSARGGDALPDILPGAALNILLVPEKDTDNDGLSDIDEVENYGTNPLNADSDGDGLSDGEEVSRYGTDPLRGDSDGDGLSDSDEILIYETDPMRIDSDGDGLSDGDEILVYGTNPNYADTDGDSLPDGWEVQYSTDPLAAFTGLPELNIQKVGSYSKGAGRYSWNDMALLDGDRVILAGSYWDSSSGVVAVVSLDTPSMPQLLMENAVDGEVRAIEAVGNTAYVGIAWPSAQLQVWDCANPGNPVVVQTFDNRWVAGLALGSLYSSDGWTIEKFDNSSPTNIFSENSAYLNEYSTQLLKHHGLLYLSRSEWTGSQYAGSLLALDSVTLESVGSCSVPGDWMSCLAGWSNTIFSATSDWSSPDGISAVDVGNPSMPKVLGTFGAGRFSGLRVVSNLLYCAGSPELTVYRVDGPTNFVNLYTSPGQWGGRKVRVQGNLIIVFTGAGFDVYENKGLLDSDQDGLPDSWEMKWFGTLNYGPMDDFNHDGLLNGAAYLAGTDPTKTDSDGDGLSDYDEVWIYHSRPTEIDTDGDGLTDFDEVMGIAGYVTRPDLSDTDGDGASDPVEIDLGRNPCSASDAGGASSIAGTIRGAGVALADAHVAFYGQRGTLYHFASTDGAGIFSISNVVPGNYFVKVEAELFADEWYTGAYHRTNAVTYTVPVNSSVLGFNFNLSAGQSPALVEVTSDPAGATIYLDYQSLSNVTPALINVGEVGNGALSNGLSGWTASHVICVKKTGSPWPGPRAVSAKEAETVSVHFDLTSGAAGALSVVTDPATNAVEVYVDYADSVVGFSPIVVGNLAPGSHTLLLRKGGFLQPRPVNVGVQAYTTNSISLPLTSMAGNTGLCVNVATVPPGVFVHVDYMPPTTVTDAVLDWLDPASHAGVGWHSVSHVILLRKNGFYPLAPRVVRALPGQPEQMVVFLEGDPAQSMDVDADGLSDQWEAAYDLENQAPGKHGANDDADGDGISNASEMAAGTNPLDKNSGLRISTQSEIQPRLHGVTFVFSTVPGRRYILQGTEDLKDTWANMSGLIFASTTQTTVAISVPDETQHAFYRVIVLVP